jgi:hypothetical protein
MRVESYLVDVLALELGEKLVQALLLSIDADGREDRLKFV